MWPACLAAFLGILAYPPFGIAITAWLAFLPLFELVRRCERWPSAFGWAYLTGWLFWLGTIWWVGHVSIVGLAVLVTYLALYQGLFGVTVWLYFRYFSHQPVVIWLGMPTDWLILEWIRTWLFSGFGWNLLAYSQWQVLPVIQLADWVSWWGISWLIMWVNVTLYGIWRQWLPRGCVVVTIVGIGLVLGYGLVRLSEPVQGEPLKVAVIQGNIPQEQKWDEAYEAMIMERYESLTHQAAQEKPDLIIWPETAVPGYLTTEPRMMQWVQRLAREAQAYLLVGTPREERGTFSFLQQEIPSKMKTSLFFNSAALIAPDGSLVAVHDKLHLVPFGEFVPFERQFPWARSLMPPTGDFSPGQTWTLFTVHKPQVPSHQSRSAIGDLRFAVLICFEDIFPGLVHKFVRRGADMLVVITNDAWFGRSGAAEQHAAASVFRAIEHRVPVIRAANTGYSCIIDPSGRILSEVRQGPQRLFVSGFAVRAMPLR